MGMIAGKQKEAITRRTDGDVAVQLGIAGAVDFAHPALAEESNDAVAVGEHRAGRESAFVPGSWMQPVCWEVASQPWAP